MIITPLAQTWMATEKGGGASITATAAAAIIHRRVVIRGSRMVEPSGIQTGKGRYWITVCASPLGRVPTGKLQLWFTVDGWLGGPDRCIASITSPPGSCERSYRLVPGLGERQQEAVSLSGSFGSRRRPGRPPWQHLE